MWSKSKHGTTKKKKQKGHFNLVDLVWNCVLYIYGNITLLFINLFIIIILQEFWLVVQMCGTNG